jgi:hypothetical protein
MKIFILNFDVALEKRKKYPKNEKIIKKKIGV